MSAREEAVGYQPFSARFWVGRVDLRPISMFRIVFGLFLFYDLCDLFPNLRTFFSDEGVLPRPAFLGQWARQARFSALDSFGSPLLVHIFWAMAVVAVLAMAIGYRSRLASIASFILVSAFQERLPPLFDGSDTVIRMTLFWNMFVENGNLWSVDAVLAEKAGKPLAALGSAMYVRIMQLQIAWIYLCTAIHKTGGTTWRNGTAVHYTLHLDHVFSRPWAGQAEWFSDNAVIIWLLTLGTLVVEYGFIVLAFFPIPSLSKWARALGVLAVSGLHIGIAFTINVGLFSYLMPLTMLMFYEPDWIQWIKNKVDAALGEARLTSWRALAEKFPAPAEGAGLAAYFEPFTLERLRHTGRLLVAFWFVICTWYAIPKAVQPPMPKWTELLIQYSDTWSSWDMFSPDPLRTDYRLTAPIEFEDGTTGNVFGGAADGIGDYRGFWFSRWWKYFENVTGTDTVLPLEWGRYICRERNFYLKPGESRLYSFTLYKDDQIIPPIGQPWPPVTRRAVWVHRCFDKPAGAATSSTPAKG